MSEMSKEELLEWLGDFKKAYFEKYKMPFIPDLLAEQAYQQIRKYIKENPKLTKTWANGWIGCLHGRWKIPVTKADAIVYGILDEANIKVDK